MIKAIIIDDELKARKALAGLIQNFIEGVQILGEAASAEEGFSLIQESRPDLVFLDIEMPGGSGFELLAKFGEAGEEGIPFEIVFTTAYNQYAIQAIKFSALDYLLKPINIADLQGAVDRVREKRESPGSEGMKVLIEHLKNLKKSPDKLVLPTVDGFHVVKLDEIIRIESSSNYSKFFLAGGSSIMVSKTLKEYEKLLGESGFFRPHQSHLINLDHVRKYARGQARHIIMSDGSKVEVSKRNREEFVRIFSEMFKG